MLIFLPTNTHQNKNRKEILYNNVDNTQQAASKNHERIAGSNYVARVVFSTHISLQSCSVTCKVRWFCVAGREGEGSEFEPQQWVDAVLPATANRRRKHPPLMTLVKATRSSSVSVVGAVPALRRAVARPLAPATAALQVVTSLLPLPQTPFARI